MLATHAPSSLINALQLFRSHSLFSRAISPFSATRSLFVQTVASMVGVNSAPDHVVGTWYSVPELRLRNHRFVVPLDYSLEPCSSPKISVFACEVVADCRSFMETFQEVAESQGKKEDNKDASDTAGLLEKLNVGDDKTEGKEQEEKPDVAKEEDNQTYKEEDKKAVDDQAKPVAENKDEPAS